MRIGWGIAALVGVLAVAAVVFWPDSGSDDVAEPAASASASPVGLRGRQRLALGPSAGRRRGLR